MNELLRALRDTGLLQFGRFERNGSMVPWRLGADYLAAYPDVLRLAAGQIGTLLAQYPVDRLIAAPEAVVLGVAVTLHTGLPLVYSRGRGEAAAYDLVGAYDSGHRAAVIVNVFEHRNTPQHLINEARSVGLRVERIVSLLDLEDAATSGEQPPVQALLTLRGAVMALEADGWLPLHQRQAVLRWIEDQRTEVIRHRDEAAP